MKNYPMVSIKDSVATRLLTIVFGIYFIVTLTLTVSHMVMEYVYAKDKVIGELKTFQLTFEPGLAKSLWLMHTGQLESTIKGMLHNPSIVGIRILDELGNTVISSGRILNKAGKVEYVGGSDEAENNISSKEKYSSLFWHKFPIQYENKNSVVKVGDCTLYSSTRVVFERVQLQFILIMVNAFVKTLSLWIIFLIVARLLLTRPLTILTSAAAQLQLDNLESLKIDVKTKGRNELKFLEEAFNAMVEKLKKARTLLEDANRTLEGKVKERTFELEQKTTELETSLTAQKQLSENLMLTNRELETSQKNLIVSNSELTRSRDELEQQNTALLATNRKLEDLNTTKEQLLEKLSSVRDTHFNSLQKIHENLLDTVKEGKDQVRQAIRELHQIDEILRPVNALYNSEKAIQSKKVLLAETNRKQQIVAKMALGGTGVELDIIDNIEEGESLLNKNRYDVICTNAELIQLGHLAIDKHADTQCVFMTSESASSYLSTLRNNPFLSNIVSRNDDDRTFTLKNIIVTISKLLNHDLFGLEKYLSWGVDVHEHAIIGSADRENLISMMEDDFKALGIRRNVIVKCITVADELLMNAIYDAPTDAEGVPLYNHLPRTVPVELTKNQQGKFRYACDGSLLAVSAEDPFGALYKETILQYLESCYGGEAGTLNKAKGGAGRGLFEIMETSDLVVMDVKANVRTEVVAIFNIDPGKSKTTKTTSFHYFYG